MEWNLRGRLGVGAVISLAVGVVFHMIETSAWFNRLTTDSAGNLTSAGPSGWFGVLASLGGFFVTLALLLAAGVVASFVIEEALERRLWMDAAVDEEEGDLETQL